MDSLKNMSLLNKSAMSEKSLDSRRSNTTITVSSGIINRMTESKPGQKTQLIREKLIHYLKQNNAEKIILQKRLQNQKEVNELVQHENQHLLERLKEMEHLL